MTSRRRRRLPFPAWLERRFEAETGQRYAQIVSGDLTRTALFYNIFILADFLLTLDTVWLSAALHFLLVTPVMLLIAWRIRKGAPPLARDLMGAAVPFLIACQILCIFAASGSSTASHYLFLVALNAATVNTSVRLRHRAATWATWATFVALVATLAATNKIPATVAVMQCFAFGVCGVVTLRGMADREREFRRAYLNALRDRLKIAAVDAEANHDPLTGVANRRGLEIAARAAWEGASGDQRVAVILFDIDEFKAYNDLYGHLAGDACLRAIASDALYQMGRRDGLLARYGGEEFLVLLTGAAAQKAGEFAEQLRCAVLALNIMHAGARGRGIVSASFGVASGRVSDFSFDALAAAADAALYAAKAAGRNKVTRALAA